MHLVQELKEPREFEIYRAEQVVVFECPLRVPDSGVGLEMIPRFVQIPDLEG